MRRMDITVGRLSGGLLGDPMYLLAGGVGQIRATGVGVDDKAGRDNQSVKTKVGADDQAGSPAREWAFLVD